MNDPQNIYDNPEFFTGYSQMERFGEGWTRALEQPMFLDLLPDPTGLRVLGLGCGVGQLSYRLANAGASEVVAIDVSKDYARRRAARAQPSTRQLSTAGERGGPL